MNLDEEPDRDALKRADPAASLSPLSPDRFERLRVAAMTETTPTANPTNRTRVRAAWGLAAGAAALAIGAFAVPALTPATPPTALTAGGVEGIAAKCIEVTTASFDQVDLAFKATATTIEGDSVTLTVTDRYTGEVTDTVNTTQGDGQISDGGPLVYEEGASYLIAVSDGTILSCGISSAASDYLEGVYKETYGK